MARHVRYGLTQQKEDLDKSIVHGTEAIFLPAVSQDEDSFNIAKILFHLAHTLLERSSKFKQPEDPKHSIEYLRYLRRLPLESFKVPRSEVTGTLIRALATQVSLDTGYGTQNIKEMVVLCRELLTSNTLTDFPLGAFQSLTDSVAFEYTQRRPLYSPDELIECLRDAANMCPPDSHFVFLALALQLYFRFIKTHSNDDYEEAAALFERILDPNQPGNCPDLIRVHASRLANILPITRASISQNPEYFEVAISRLRTELNSSAYNEESRILLTDNLALLNKIRFLKYGLAESLEEANSFTSQLINISSSESLVKSWEPFIESDAVWESYSMSMMTEKFSTLKNCSQLLLQGPDVTKSTSIALQSGMKQSSNVRTMYQISKIPSSIAGYYSVRLVLPIPTIGDLSTSVTFTTFSASRSRKLARSGTSKSLSLSAMTFSS